MDNLNTNGEQIQPGKFDLFVGMDVDKRSVAMTLLNDLGQKTSLKMDYDPEGILSYVRHHFPERCPVFVYEAGPTGFGLHDAITGTGYTCLVVSPSSVPMVKSKRVKTNRLDSLKLAESLRGGQIKGIRVPTEAYRELRELVQLRNMFVEQIRANKFRIKALLLRNSIAFPDAAPRAQWCKRVIWSLKELDPGRTLRFKLDRLIDGLEWAQEQAVRTQSALRQSLESDPELADSMRFLMSIPGIGWVIASAVLARVGDWRLLGNSEEMASFLGLVPTETSTGDREDRGSISRTGDARLRSQLIQGAWTAIGRDLELGEFYQRVCRCHPRHIAAKVAIVAVARKLATRMHCMLRERREYEVRRAA